MATADDLDAIQDAIASELAGEFNSKLGEFIRKLIRSFPDSEAKLRTVYNQVRVAMQLDKHVPIAKFASAIVPCTALIEGKDESFFTNVAPTMPHLDGLDLPSLWKAASENTRLVIWDYVTLLQRIASSHASCFEKKTQQEVSAAVIQQVQQMAQLSDSMVQDFQADHHRAPTAQDDLSLYSYKVAEQLGLDLGALDKINLRDVQREIDAVDFNQFAPPGTKTMTKRQAKEMSQFVMRQLRGLQTRLRLKAKVTHEKEGCK
jgi:hypothetical protein